MSSGRSYRHPIVSRRRKVIIRPSATIISSAPFCYNPCPGLRDAFIALENQIFLTEQALQQYYQPDRAVSEFIARMDARCTVPPVIFVRLVWRQENPRPFNINEIMDRLDIKDIYVRYGFQYKDDPIFNDTLGRTLVPELYPPARTP
jgi:hypothetical protein